MEYRKEFVPDSAVRDSVKGKNGSSRHLSRNIVRPRLFISYCFSDRDKVALMRQQRKRGSMDFVDYSVKEPYDSRWKSGVKYRIKISDAIQINIGPGTADSRSIKYEYDQARKRKKPVYGVMVKPGSRVPDYMVRDGCRIVSWRCNEIQNTLDSSMRENRSRSRRRHLLR